MATHTATSSGRWSTTGGSPWDSAPHDDKTDKVIINAGVDLEMDTVMTQGLVGNCADSMTINSSNGTPGMLVFKYRSGVNGKLIIDGTTAAGHIRGGSSGTNKGRILASYSGLWIGCTQVSRFGLSGVVTNGGGAKRIFTPAVSPAWPATGNPLAGEAVVIDGTSYAAETNDATSVLLTTGPAVGATTSWSLVVRPLPVAQRAEIALLLTSHIDAQYLDIALEGAVPANKSVRTYGTTSTFTTEGDDILILNVASSIILTNNTPVHVSTAGVLPTGLTAGILYYVRDVSGNTCKLETSIDGGAIAITDAGTGIHCITHGIVKVDSIASNLIDVEPTNLPATPWATGQPVMFTSSGTYPTGISANTLYWIRDLTAASGTFKIAAVAGGAALTLGTSWTGTLRAYIGSAATTCTSIAVLDDIAADPCWIPTADSTWATTLGLSAVVLADEGPADYDQQRMALVAATASTVTFGNGITGNALIDSAQYPNARIWLVSRNVAITSTCVTNISIIDYTSGAAGVFGCEIRSIGNTIVTTFSGSGVNAGSGHTFNTPSFAGCSSGVYYGSGHTFNTPSFAGCSYGVYAGSGEFHNAIFSGNTYDIVPPCVIVGVGAALPSTVIVSTGYKIPGCANGRGPRIWIYDALGAGEVLQPNYVRGWSPGGTVATTVYVVGTHGTPTIPTAYVHVATYEGTQATGAVATVEPVAFEWPVFGQAGVPVSVTMQVRSRGTNGSVVAMVKRPTITICDPEKAYEAVGESLATATAAAVAWDNTAWETLTVTYTPTVNKPLVIRFSGCAGFVGAEYWTSYFTMTVAASGPLVGASALVSG